MHALKYFAVAAYGFLELLRRNPIREERSENLSNALVGLALTLMTLIPPLLRPLAKSSVAGSYTAFIGTAIAFVGIWIRASAITALGRFYSRNVGIQGEHRLVQEGWYRHIRHPGYLGTFVTFLGYAAACASWLALPLNLCVYFAAYAYRIKVEEETLIERFGDEYVLYQNRSWRLIPYVY